MTAQSHNDGWNLCAEPGCDKRPRLSGLCTQHENEALAWALDCGLKYSEPKASAAKETCKR